jgi:hypothetical protein
VISTELFKLILQKITTGALVADGVVYHDSPTNMFGFCHNRILRRIDACPESSLIQRKHFLAKILIKGTSENEVMVIRFGI